MNLLLEYLGRDEVNAAVNDMKSLAVGPAPHRLQQHVPLCRQPVFQFVAWRKATLLRTVVGGFSDHGVQHIGHDA